MNEVISLTLVVDECKDVVGDCLESILNQDSQSYELIIIDNATEDGTFDIVTKYMYKFLELGVYCRVTRNRKKYNKLYNAAAAFGASIGDYVFRITPEMRLPKGFISVIRKVILDKNPGAIILQKSNEDNSGQNIILDFTLQDGQIIENRLVCDRVAKHRETFMNYRDTYRAFLFSIIDNVEALTIDYQDVRKNETSIDLLSVLEQYRLLLACNEISSIYKKDIDVLLKRKYREVKEQCLEYSMVMEKQGNEQEAFRYKQLARLF